MKSPIFKAVNDQIKEHLKFPMQKEMDEAMRHVTRILAENKEAMAMAFAAETGCDPANVVCVIQGSRMWFEPRYLPECRAIYITKDGLECIERLPTGSGDHPLRYVQRVARDASSFMRPTRAEAKICLEKRTYMLTGEKKKGLWVYREV